MATDSREMATWVTRARAGDREAFDRLVRRFQDPAVGYAYTLLGNFAAAEDAAQEAFLQAHRDLPALQEPEAFPAWLRRIVFKYADRARRRRTVPAVPLDSVTEAGDAKADPLYATQREADRAAVRAAVGTLTDGERQVVTLFYLGEQSVAEVAAFLGLTEATVKKRLQRARTRLRERTLTMLQETLRENAPSRDNRFAEVTALLRTITETLEADPNVGAAYLAHFGSGEGWGGEDDVWASVNLHVVLSDAAMDALATGRREYAARAGEPLACIEAFQNAPADGYYLMALYDGESGPYEVDWYWHPRSQAYLPADTRLLFDRVGLPARPEPTKWEFREAMPDALRRVRETMTDEERWREGQANRIGLFWAMWLISAKYTARDPKQEQVPFLGMLRDLARDARQALGDAPLPDGDEPTRPTPEAKIQRLRQLGADMEEVMSRSEARGVPAPTRLVPRAYRFLDLVERAV